MWVLAIQCHAKVGYDELYRFIMIAITTSLLPGIPMWMSLTSNLFAGINKAPLQEPRRCLIEVVELLARSFPQQSWPPQGDHRDCLVNQPGQGLRASAETHPPWLGMTTTILGGPPPLVTLTRGPLWTLRLVRSPAWFLTALRHPSWFWHHGTADVRPATRVSSSHH